MIFSSFGVARMMMMGCKFMGKPPFPTIYLHAMVRDRQGNKMSKTRGNVIDPLHLIHGCTADEVSPQFKKEYPDGFPAFGADALRFTLAAMSGSGRDIKLSVERIAGYRAFANKIWNASRFALMRLDGATPPSVHEIAGSLTPADRYILSQLAKATAEINHALEAFRFADAANAIYHFFWNEFCDWYIELIKPRLMQPNATTEAAQATLVTVLERAMALLHPMMPFISEEIWQRLPLAPAKKAELPASIMLAPYPANDVETFADPQIDQDYATVKDAIVGIRTIRSESNVAPSKTVPALLLSDNDTTRAILEAHRDEITGLARVESLTIATSKTNKPAQSSTRVVGDLEVVVPLAGLVDFAEEAARLRKAIGKTEKERDRLAKKLDNPKFVANAPKDVVAKDKARLDELAGVLSKLSEGLSRIEQ